MTDTKFKPGTSGNPMGRPKGSRDKRTQHRELFESRAPELINTVINKAIDGDTQCLKICIDRILAPYRPKDEGINLDIDDGSTNEILLLILEQMYAGKLSVSESGKMLSALETKIRISDNEEHKRSIPESFKIY